MAYKKSGKTSSEVAEEIQAEITSKFVDCLNHGVVPWHKSWNASESGFLSSSGKSYSFMNSLLIAIGGGEKGEYVTLKGLEERTHTSAKDGTVWDCFIRGVDGGVPKSHRIYFYSMVRYTKKDSDGKPRLDDDGNEITGAYPLLKASSVWHIGGQVDAEKCPLKFEKFEQKNNNPIHELEKVVLNYQAREQIKGIHKDYTTPAYHPVQDFITLPHIHQFKTPELYYQSLFHEIAHSTGHAKRLNRELDGKMSSDSYSFEELIAEITSACILHDKGFATDDTNNISEAYVKGWAKSLKSDPAMVEKACRMAVKAANYIYNGK